jgi:NAD(P)-dependent dehydrogenase (short-subunit alcohol dehydrogenase family)
VQVAALDLADPASVAGFVRAWSGPLHILVNNAGVMALPKLTRTTAGYKMQFATNHLGHFALTTGLHGWLADAGGARVAAVSSIGHLYGPVVFDDLHYRFRPYDQWTSYGQSKSAIVLFAVAAAQRWADDGIAVNALMPGNIASTALVRHLGPDDFANLGKETDVTLPPEKTIEQGAATSVLLAASPELEGVTGRYYEDCAEAPEVQEREGHAGGVAPYALDPDNADREQSSIPVDQDPYAASVPVVSSGRSTSLPFSNVAPARTSATRCGALTARQRDCAASISL